VRGHVRRLLTERSISEGLRYRIMGNGLIKERGIRGILTLLLHVNKRIPNLNKPFIYPIQLLLLQQLHFLHITKRYLQASILMGKLVEGIKVNTGDFGKVKTPVNKVPVEHLLLTEGCGCDHLLFQAVLFLVALVPLVVLEECC
jgi:hypothetical protein